MLAGAEDRHGSWLGAVAERSADGTSSRARPGRHMAGKEFLDMGRHHWVERVLSQASARVA